MDRGEVDNDARKRREMRNTGFYALGVAVVMILSGCGGPPQAGGSTFLAPQVARSEPHRISQIDPAARSKDLIYASSVYTCDVDVFSYPHGKLVQTLSACGLGFGPAFGLCSDGSGNVFMTMGDGFSVFEYQHGGTQPIAQLEDNSILPLGCSVDPKTGDLAVASAEGNVAIFKNASGSPHNYYLSGVSEFFFCTYDGRGNLFADGEHYDGSFALAELPKGGSALQEITVPGGLTARFAVQWDGRDIAVGAMQGSNEFSLDRIRVSGSTAKIVSTTTLTFVPNTFTPFQFWIEGGKIVQPESNNAELGFWRYPRGGEQTKGITIQGSTFAGVTVSRATR